MSTETRGESTETLSGMSYVDVLRELSARYRIKPEDVTSVLDHIKSVQGPVGREKFEGGMFELEMSAEGDQQKISIISIIYNGATYTYDVIPYRGQVKTRNEMASFSTLRAAEHAPAPKSVPTVMPSVRRQLADVGMGPFADGSEEGETGCPYGASPSESGFLIGEGPVSQKLRLGFDGGFDSLRNRALDAIDDGE